jgi:hypothetical protein
MAQKQASADPMGFSHSQKRSLHHRGTFAEQSQILLCPLSDLFATCLAAAFLAVTLTLLYFRSREGFEWMFCEKNGMQVRKSSLGLPPLSVSLL